MKKECFKCNETKLLSDFYKHDRMKDGYLNKCKECTKKDSTKTRNNNIEHYREYDRARGNRQGREYQIKYRSENPRKYASHIAVNNAVRKGILLPQPCENCNSNEYIVTHHDDYSKQLDVRWL